MELLSRLLSKQEIKKYNLLLIEDAAQSFGATQNKKKSCSFGDIAATSFYPAKPLGCYGDGGAIFTNNSKLAKKIQLMYQMTEVKLLKSSKEASLVQ